MRESHRMGRAEFVPTILTAKFLNIQIDSMATIGNKCVDRRIGDTAINTVEIVASASFGRDGFGAPSFAFDEGPGFNRTNEGARCGR